jgi:CheY-like chemotaxis protein
MVEDDPITRADLRLVLEDAGFEVCEDARDGVEAVELARTSRPDLVLMDLVLPRVDGVEAIRRIRDERDTPVVALTGHREGDLVDRAMQAGAAAHVLKPFHAAELVGTVTRTLADHRARTDAADWERRHQLIRIEAMVRNGYEHRHITRALKDGGAWDYDHALPTSWVRVLRGLFRR